MKVSLCGVMIYVSPFLRELRRKPPKAASLAPPKAGFLHFSGHARREKGSGDSHATVKAQESGRWRWHRPDLKSRHLLSFSFFRASGIDRAINQKHLGGRGALWVVFGLFFRRNVSYE